MQLSGFPRRRFAHLPTPLEPMPRLSELLGGPNLWVKRDDCTGLAGGGNKTRKLEFLIADALGAGAETVITAGAPQSNHCRQTAAAAARHGLDCDLLFEDRPGMDHLAYTANGNVLLDRLFGATLHSYPTDTDMALALAEAGAAVSAEGRRPYVIPIGGSNPIGALGYVDRGHEIVHRANSARIQVDQVVHATGSAGTQAGLLTGLSESGIPVLGVSVSSSREELEEKVHTLARATADLIGAPGAVTGDQVVVDDDHIGQGYGIPAESTVEAVTLLAQTEGILLDPVYTGKAAAGLISLIRSGRFARGENIVFLHTGGAQVLSAYRDAFGFEPYR